jgi:hypothetical protein
MKRLLFGSIRFTWMLLFLLAASYMTSSVDLRGDQARAFGQLIVLFVLWLAVDSRLPRWTPAHN